MAYRDWSVDRDGKRVGHIGFADDHTRVSAPLADEEAKVAMRPVPEEKRDEVGKQLTEVIRASTPDMKASALEEEIRQKITGTNHSWNERLENEAHRSDIPGNYLG